MRATALARLGLDITCARPTLDMAFEGANRDFERFPSISAGPAAKPILGQIAGLRWQRSTRDTVSTGMARKSLIFNNVAFLWPAGCAGAKPGCTAAGV